MTSGSRDELAAHLQPEVTEGRLARQWSSVQRKLPRRSGTPALRIMLWSVPGFSACLFLLWSQQPQRPLSGAVIESSDTPVTVQLRDGSNLELAAQTRLRVLRDQPAAVEIELTQGRASFDVTHVEKRTFSVRAGVVSVRVVGTQFEVLKTGRREGMEVEVAVKRGIVEVQRADRGGDVRRITAGETWSAWISSDPAAKPLAAWISSDSAAATPEPTVVNTPEPPKPSIVEQPAPAPAPRTAPTPAAPSVDKHAAAEGVRALFLRANVARRAGRVQEAANAYAELLKSFPRDSRAAVSAFELGRIRMDALSDPKAAAAAFAESLRLSHRAQFREDALARLALAYDATGEWDSCRKVRGRYLTDYPGGVHTNALSSLCGEHAD